MATAPTDIETGLAQQALSSGLALSAADDRSVVSMSNYVAGVLLFLFLAGLLPLSLLVLASVLLVCLATCIRAYVVHQFEQRLNSPQGRSRLAEALQLVSAAHPLLAGGSQLDLANLRLSLVQRDFGSGDYESLLALDAARAPCRRVSEHRIRALPTYKHRSPCGGKPGEEHLCCVCLEAYSDGSAVTQLPCAHAFHADCIQPWLRQQGLAATCPLCKAHVWPQK